MKTIVRLITQIAEDIRAIRVATERIANRDLRAAKSASRERR